MLSLINHNKHMCDNYTVHGYNKSYSIEVCFLLMIFPHRLFKHLFILFKPMKCYYLIPTWVKCKEGTPYRPSYIVITLEVQRQNNMSLSLKVFIRQLE